MTYTGRERAIPCRGATLQESIRGTHKTWDDDGYCDRCRARHAQAVARVRADQARRLADSLPDSTAADRLAPASPLATPQVER